jgi:dipeptidyl-peptidase 4
MNRPSVARPCGVRLRSPGLPRLLLLAAACVAAAPLALAPGPLAAQSFSLEDVLESGFAYELVSATRADRIAWLENERGMRNVYTAAAPDFVPVRLTAFLEDDGTDLTGLQISEDGSVVMFIRGHAPNRVGWVANPSSHVGGAERALWAVVTDGTGQPWRVVEANGGTLSPDGRSVVYMKEGEVHRAIVHPSAEPGVAERSGPLFRVWGQPRGPVWSPDGRRIAFVTDRETHSFVGVYDAQQHRIIYLAPGVDRDGSPTWSPDGRRIAFTRRPGRPFGQEMSAPDDLPDHQVPAGFRDPRFRGGHALEIWIADVETGEGGRLWHSTPGDSVFGGIGTIQWRGEHLVFGVEADDWLRYYSISTVSAAPDPVPLTHAVGFPENVAFSVDGTEFFFATNHGDIDRRHLWRVPVAGGTPRQLTRGEGIETFPAVLATGGQVALLSAGAARPQSVAVVAAAGGEPRVVSRIPDTFPAGAHVIPTNVTLTAADSLEFHNQLFLPRDLRPGERRPALIFIHGGPRRQMLLGYNYGHFYHMAYAVNQYFASKGYIVLSVNYRGGIGYGRTFRNAPNMGRNGNSEYQDILAAGEYLRDRPDVDPGRIALWGLSYGGILTAQGLARNSDLFASGADIAGVHFWGETLDPRTVNYSASSASRIEDWTSPVLLVHGDDDRNVAFAQTVGLVQLLRAHDVPYELIVFPDEVHSFLVHDRWLQTFQAMDDFFDRTLIRKEGVRAEDREVTTPP